MQIRRALAAVALALVAGPALALEPPGYDQMFVDAFAEACVPGRLAYETTYAVALAAGWSLVERADHPELAAVMQKSDEALAAETDMDMDFVGALFARDVAGVRHHLSVTQSTFIIEEGDDPWVMVGCHLYNFDATQPIDPTFVTALIGKPIANSIDHEGMLGHVWGPGCTMPRTSDTYLGFVAEGSLTVETVGFSGLSLNFSTSTPDAGEEVPETYC
jgi:hypothetical protein